MSYSQILKQAYVMEALGETIYQVMSFKEKNITVSANYLMLSKNESNMKVLLERELKKYFVAPPEKKARVYSLLSRALFKALPLVFLQKILSHVLNKRKFDGYYKKYHNLNLALWRALLDHEKVQFRVLYNK